MSSKYAKLALEDTADEQEQHARRSESFDKRSSVHSAAESEQDGMMGVDMSDALPSPFVASQLHPQSVGSSASSIDGDESSQLMDESDGARSQSDASRPAGLIVLDEQPPREGEVRVTCMRLGGTGHGSVQLNAPLNSTVRQLIERAYSHELHELHQRVRILFCGRMLSDDDVLSASGIKHECVLHAHITDIPPSGMQLPHVQPQQLLDGSGNGAAQPHPTMEIIDLESGNLNGFDPAHYSAEQLNTLRQAQVDLERELMQPVGPREGNNSDLLLGVFLGFVLGWLAILCLYSPALSRKHRLGLLLGLMLNLMMILLNHLDPAPSSDAAGEPYQEVIDPREGAEGVANS